MAIARREWMLMNDQFVGAIVGSDGGLTVTACGCDKDAFAQVQLFAGSRAAPVWSSNGQLGSPHLTRDPTALVN